MKKIFLSVLSVALLAFVTTAIGSVTFSGVSLQSAAGNPLGLTAGQVGIYVNADNVANWLSFNGTGTLGSGLSLFNSATYGTGYTFLGNASVSGTTTLTLSGGAFSPLTYTGGVGAGDQFAVIVFNSSTTITTPGDTFNVWRASDWSMPVDGSTLTFSTAPSPGASIQRVNANSYLVASGSVVPEPSTYALLALGGLSLFCIARRRKSQKA